MDSVRPYPIRLRIRSCGVSSLVCRLVRSCGGSFVSSFGRSLGRSVGQSVVFSVGRCWLIISGVSFLGRLLWDWNPEHIFSTSLEFFSPGGSLLFSQPGIAQCREDICDIARFFKLELATDGQLRTTGPVSTVFIETGENHETGGQFRYFSKTG